MLETAIQDFKNTSSSDEQPDEDLTENVHFTTIAFEDFVVRFAQKHLSDNNPQVHAVRDKVGEQESALSREDDKDSSLDISTYFLKLFNNHQVKIKQTGIHETANRNSETAKRNTEINGTLKQYFL